LTAVETTPTNTITVHTDMATESVVIFTVVVDGNNFNLWGKLFKMMKTVFLQ